MNSNSDYQISMGSRFPPSPPPVTFTAPKIRWSENTLPQLSRKKGATEQERKEHRGRHFGIKGMLLGKGRRKEGRQKGKSDSCVEWVIYKTTYKQPSSGGTDRRSRIIGELSINYGGRRKRFIDPPASGANCTSLLLRVLEIPAVPLVPTEIWGYGDTFLGRIRGL